MSDACFRVEELEEVAALTDGDQRLRHLDDCPRCRALITTYREFVEPSAVPAGANIAGANAQLSAVLRREIGEEGPDNRFARFLSGLLRPAWRPALVVAGVLVVLFLLPERGVFRGEGDPITTRRIGAEGTMSITLHPADFLSGGEIRLSWVAADEANSYQVALYSTELEELARLNVGTARELVIDPTDVLGSPPAGESLLWRVIALSGGDEVVRSTPQSISLP